MLRIDLDTKIGSIIKANKEAIEAIASIAPPFQKLKNPILRRFIASRVSLREAIEMGNCTIVDFKRVLEPLGFFFDLNSMVDPNPSASLAQPEWLESLSEADIIRLDVRPLIENGKDPLRIITDQYQSLQTGQVLCVINSFVPSPLIALLGKKEAQSYVQNIERNCYYCWFYKNEVEAKNIKSISPGISSVEPVEFEQLISSSNSDKLRTIDVRGLPMPIPMERILEALQQLPTDEKLYVYHHRVPLYLLEELQQQNYSIVLSTYDDEDIRLLITHGK